MIEAGFLVVFGLILFVGYLMCYVLGALIWSYRRSILALPIALIKYRAAANRNSSLGRSQ